MKEQSEENTKKEVIEKKTIRIFRGHLFIKLVIILLLVLAVIAGIAGLRKGSGQPAESESKTTRIGFENIGQMVTQAFFPFGTYGYGFYDRYYAQQGIWV